MIESFYFQNLMKEQGKEFNIRLYTDSSAALGHFSRLGNGKKMRRLEPAELGAPIPSHGRPALLRRLPRRMR